MSAGAATAKASTHTDEKSGQDQQVGWKVSTCHEWHLRKQSVNQAANNKSKNEHQSPISISTVSCKDAIEYAADSCDASVEPE